MKKFCPGVRVVVKSLAEDPQQGIEENLEIEAQAVPDLQQLLPTDVMIGVRSSAVSWVDLLMTSGQYQHQPPLPYTPGLEYAGTVLWCGSDVSPDRLALGDSVFVSCFDTGPRSAGPYQKYGGFASYAVAPQTAVRPLPHYFNFDEACNFSGNYETAYHCLVDCGALKTNETILIHGACGATGLAAVQIAKTLGARVIATGRSAEKLEVVKQNGADHVICFTDVKKEAPERLRDLIKGLTDGLGVDVVYDPVGGDLSVESLRCAKFGARYLIVGWAATPLVAKGRGGRGAPNANQLPTNLILMKGLQVIGAPMVIATQKQPSIRAPRLSALDKWAAAGSLRPHISHVFELNDVKKAMLARWQGKILGGCALRPPV